ncbi:MAG: hypothetical protein ACYDBV_00460 [Nitrospiria bacterium]
MDDFEEGKNQFLQILKQLDSAVQAVIPVTPSNGHFLISLTRKNARKFMTVSEDDILDLPADHTIRNEVEEQIKETIESMKE